jgi:hypothetical protein
MVYTLDLYISSIARSISNTLSMSEVFSAGPFFPMREGWSDGGPTVLDPGT